MAEALSTGIIAILIAGAILTVGATIWAAILSWGPIIIIIFIGGVGLTFFSLNQYRLWRGRRSIQIERIEPVVRNWLYRNKFSIQDDPQPNAIFQFVARDE